VRGSEHGSGLGHTRFVIERTHSWFGNFRRLVQCYERKGAHFLGFQQLAACVICARRLRLGRQPGEEFQLFDQAAWFLKRLQSRLLPRASRVGDITVLLSGCQAPSKIPADASLRKENKVPHSERSRTLNSSFHCCLRSRLWQDSSNVPTSVTLLCRWTG